MIHLKKLTVYVLIISLMIFALSCSSQEQVSESEDPKTIRWVIAHTPETYFLQAATTFKDLVESHPQANVQVEILSLANVSNGTEVSALDLRTDAERLIEEGKTDMVQIYTRSLVDSAPKMAVFDTPYLFRDYRHVDAVVDGDIGQEILAELKDSSLKGLAFTFSGGYLVFVSLEEDIASLEDLKGKTVRPSASTVSTSTYELLGIEEKIILNEYGKKFSLTEHIDQNLVDTLEANYYDLFDFIEQGGITSAYLSNHRVLFTSLVMNRETFDSLSPLQQQVVQDAAVAAAKAEREAIEADEQRLKELEGYEDIFVEPSPEEMNTLKQLLEPVRPEFIEVVGSELIERIEATS